MCTLLGLDKLKRGTDGICGGIGRAAEQAVGNTHLHEHGAEVVALGESRAAFLGAHLALAERYHFLDHCVHALVGHRVKDLKALDVETALCGSGLDLVNVADENGSEEALLLEAGCALKNACVVTLGIYYLAGIVFKNFDKIFKHFLFPPDIAIFIVKNPYNTLSLCRKFFKHLGKILFTNLNYIGIIYRL